MNVCSLMKQMWKLRKQDKHWQKMGKKESEYNEQDHLGEELPEGICSKLNVYRQNLKTFPNRRLSILTLRIQDTAVTTPESPHSRDLGGPTCGWKIRGREEVAEGIT